MIDLSSSSDEENFIVDTSRDAKLTKKLFGDFNRDILGPPVDDKIIVLIDSDDKTEAQEEKTVGIEPTTAPAFADLASSAPTSANDAPVGVKIGNSDDQGPDQEADGGDGDRCSVGEPYAATPRTRYCGRRASRTPMMHCSAFSLFLLCHL
jgi:hypothetical protein